MKKKLTILLIIDVLLLVVLFLPAITKHRRVSSSMRKLLEKKALLEPRLKNMKKEEAIFEVEAKKLQRFSATNLFHGDQGFVEVRSILNQALSRSGISFTGLNFSRPSSSVGRIYIIQISIPKVITTYQKLRKFIFYIENSEKLLIIKNVSIQREKGGKISATMNLEAYFNET